MRDLAQTLLKIGPIAPAWAGKASAVFCCLVMPWSNGRAQEPAAPPASSAVIVDTATPPDCTKTDFETVVDQAAAALRDLNLQNKPRFQEKLRELKDKRGWSEDDFLKEATPFVKDEEIDRYDQRTNDLLGQITAMGDEGSAAKVPDCNLFQTLRGHMASLVQTQNAKWSYMFGKIEAELAR